MKRFWKEVSTAETGDGFLIKLDGRDVRTPGKALLALPSEPLAEHVAAEWEAQDAEINPASMPLTGLANAAIDLIGSRRSEIIDTIAGYAETDLLCYRAEGPAELQAKQHADWQPLLDWAEQTYGARLVATEGVVPVVQAPEAVEALRAGVEMVDDWSLTALNVLTQGLGSIVLGLAVLEGRLEAEQGFALSQLDELWQERQWGQDAEAAERREGLKRQVAHAASFVSLARS